METIKQIILISSNLQMLEDGGPQSEQGPAKIFEVESRYVIYTRRGWGMNEREKIIHRLEWMWLEWDATRCNLREQVIMSESKHPLSFQY